MGLDVGEKLKNTSSIGAELSNFDELPGIREISLSEFGESAKLTKNLGYVAADDTARVKALADEIRASNRIDPLIVVYDKEGPYILEGGHRFEAIKVLGKKSFPAKVVVNADDLTLDALENVSIPAAVTGAKIAAPVIIKPALAERIGTAISPDAAWKDLQKHGAGDGKRIPSKEAREMVDLVWKDKEPGYTSIEQWMADRRDRWDAMRTSSKKAKKPKE